MTQFTPTSDAQLLSLRRGDHEDAARVAIEWLSDRHRKGWRTAFGARLEQPSIRTGRVSVSWALNRLGSFGHES